MEGISTAWDTGYRDAPQELSEHEGHAGKLHVSWAIPPSENHEATSWGFELALGLMQLALNLTFLPLPRLLGLPHHAWVLKWQFESFLREE